LTRLSGPEAPDDNHAPSFEIQELYQSHADGEQRAAMLEAASGRRPTSAKHPREGSMQLAGPPEHVQRAIESARASVLIEKIHPDFCTIRREFIMSRYMERRAGVFALHNGEREHPLPSADRLVYR
jgi:hypothetical protein